MTGTTQVRAQVAAAVALLLFGLFICWQSTQLKVGSPTSPGPGLFPLGLGCTLSILAIVLIVQARMGSATKAPSEDESPADYRTIALVLGLLLISALLFEPLGYLLTMTILTGALLRLAGRGWASTLLITVISVLASYWLFKDALGVPLPQGILGELL